MGGAVPVRTRAAEVRALSLRHWLARPEALLVATFAILVAGGTAVLTVPAMHGPQPLGTLDALFHATSAVCVTGLSTLPGGAGDLSRPGQIALIILVQLGGLGLLTFGAIAVQFLRLPASLTSQAALQDVFFQSEARGALQSALRRVFLLVLVCELAGALVLWRGLDRTGTGGGFEAAFLAISAFCNAGFSVYDDSVVGLRELPEAVVTLMLLITIGGLGYTVLFELLDRGWRRLRRRPGPTVRWSLHTRVVLAASALLTGGGALVLLSTGLTAQEDTFAERLVHALFQSVTARTAGFNSVHVGALPVPTLLILCALMFVGGSPGSCAGGVKTTSVVAWLARLRARLLGREDVNIGGRHLPQEIVRRAALVIAIAALWNVAGVLILCTTEPVGPALGLEDLIFEQVSAFATVGLSTGITPELSPLGKLWIIASMFVGRVGPLTVALAVVRRPRVRIAYPVERLMIG
jgi:trk system potassium uptake protein TrkH